MERITSLCAAVLVFALFAGCEEPPNQEPRQEPNPPEEQVLEEERPVLVEKPKPDVSAIIANAVELRVEETFLVTLEFAKEQLTFDLWQHAMNAASAEHRTLIVGERTFDEYRIGQELSSAGDAIGFIANGEIAGYVVRVDEKRVERQYFWADANGTQTEIAEELHAEAIAQLRASGRKLLTIPFSGVTRTYVLEKPISDYQFVAREPLRRYFVTIRVENSTVTFDLVKHMRNAATAHEITLEVPRAAYEKTGDTWDETVSSGSFVLKGHLSMLRGQVIRKWTEVDNGFELVRTADGKQFIIPA